MISQSIDKIWSSILQFSATFVTPDWGALIGLLPILLVIGVVGMALDLAIGRLQKFVTYVD